MPRSERYLFLTLTPRRSDQEDLTAALLSPGEDPAPGRLVRGSRPGSTGRAGYRARLPTALRGADQDGALSAVSGSETYHVSVVTTAQRSQ